MRLTLTVPLLLASSLAACSADDGGFARTVQGAGVRGVVCAPNGIDELPGAGIMIMADEDGDGTWDDFDPVATSQTDINGEYEITDLRPGSYVAIVRKGHHNFEFPFEYEGSISQRLQRQCFPPDTARVAMIEGTCDDPSRHLTALGFEVDRFGPGDYNGLLTNPAQLAGWDVLLAPCGMPQDWIPQAELVGAVLDEWLAAGGGLYVSGDAYGLIEAVDEELVDWAGDDETYGEAAVGMGSTVQAAITDPFVNELLGDERAELVYPADSWVMIESVAEGVMVPARGTAQTLGGAWIEQAPLAISTVFTPGRAIVYSTFGSTAPTPDMSIVLTEWVTRL